MAESFFDQDAPTTASVYAIVPKVDSQEFARIASVVYLIVCDLVATPSDPVADRIEMVGRVENLKMFAQWLDAVEYQPILWAS